MVQQSDFKPVITVTGLESAGKTTLVHRLKKGEFKEKFAPTIGFEISIMSENNTRFDVVDLGGQIAFRTAFWENFVSTCQGCIFVFDRADKSKIKSAKEWLWKVEKWLPKDASIAFLANKSDLEESMELEKIVENLDLARFSSEALHSFRIFETSSLTGENVKDCWKWITNSILRKLEKKKAVNIKAFELYDDTSSNIARIILEEDVSKNIEKAMNTFRTHSIKMIDNIPYIKIENYLVLIIRKGDYYGILYVEQDDNLSLAREYGLAILFEALSRMKRDLSLDKTFLHQVLASLDYEY